MLLWKGVSIMYGVFIDLKAETASFRDPGGQLYHNCLPLPPFSTLVGIAGAALGISFEEGLNYFRENKIKTGVFGSNQGMGRDLWNYCKIVNNDVKKDIVNREFLTNLELSIFYCSNSKNCIEEIRQAFLDPDFCLTIGNSDDLVFIKRVSFCTQVRQVISNKIHNYLGLNGYTLFPGDVSDNYKLNWDVIKSFPLHVKVSAPVIKKLPVDYKFDKQVRKGMRYEIFSFISNWISLTDPVEMYDFGEYILPLFSL